MRSQIVNFFRLIRGLNLLIIALTMILIREFVLHPIVAINSFELQLSNWKFGLLVLSTVLIAAAGNIINDYFDQRTDRVNDPDRQVVGVHIKRRVAMFIHQVFNFTGLTLALYTAWSIGMWKLSIVSFFAAGSLWFYSIHFKRDLITGNVIIAVLAGLVPLLVGIYEIPLLIKAYGPEVAEIYAQTRPNEDPAAYFQVMFYFILGYSGFAFLLNLIREIQKDMADVKGDLYINARTIPLVFGLKKAKWIVGTLIVLAIGLLLYLQQTLINDFISTVYFAIFIVLPMLVSLYLDHRAVRRSQFVRAGNALKLAMLGGILYSVVHFFIYYYTEFA